MKWLIPVFLTASLVAAHAATFGTFRTPFGDLEVEFFDEEKPMTVSNFIKYATSGRYENQFVHRWEPGFVIQGGAYRVDSGTNGFRIVPVETFAAVTNEYSVGPTFSNTYGTIAMARASRQTNSATSQWFFNLSDNSELDAIDGGFTVFGRVTSGTNILNLFVPPPPTHGIFIDTNLFPTLPVLSTNVTFNDLIYMNVSLRRDVGLQVARSIRGELHIGWNSVTGVTNILEFNTSFPMGAWQVQRSVVGTGSRIQVTDPAADRARVYRVRLFY